MMLQTSPDRQDTSADLHPKLVDQIANCCPLARVLQELVLYTEVPQILPSFPSVAVGLSRHVLCGQLEGSSCCRNR